MDSTESKPNQCFPSCDGNRCLGIISAGASATDLGYQWWSDGSTVALQRFPCGGVAPIFQQEQYILPDLCTQSLPPYISVAIRNPPMSAHQFFSFVASFQGVEMASWKKSVATAVFSLKTEAHRCFEECREKGYITGMSSVSVLFNGELL